MQTVKQLIDKFYLPTYRQDSIFENRTLCMLMHFQKVIATPNHQQRSDTSHPSLQVYTLAVAVLRDDV